MNALISASVTRFSYTRTLSTIFILALVLSAGCTKEGPVGPPGATGETDLMDPAIMPAVISTMPADRSTGPFQLYAPGLSSQPNFVIQFNKLINTLALRPTTVTVQGFTRPQNVRLYQIYYPIFSRPRGVLNGPYDNVLAFIIYDSASYSRTPYHIGSSYTITIDTSLVDINGNHLQQQSHFSFTPEPYFRSTYLYPADGSMNVSRSVYPTVTFNSPVDTSIRSSLHISPAVSGVWQIQSYDSMTAIFQFSTLFSYGTLYTISVDGNAHDAEGHPIHAGASAQFRTVNFTVGYVSPPNGSTDVSPSANIYASFNGPVDTGSIRAAFSISPPVRGLLLLSSYSVSFYPDSGFNPSTQYTATFSTALMSIDSVHLAAPYTWSFTTDQFQITYTYPTSGEIDVYRYNALQVAFNARIDTASIRPAFHISPPVGGTFSFGDSYILFYPYPSLAPLTTYTVTVDSTVRTQSGRTLGSPYTFSFKTGQ